MLLVHLANSTHFSLSDITLVLDGRVMARLSTRIGENWLIENSRPGWHHGTNASGVSMKSRSLRRKFLANAGVFSAAGVIGPSLRLPLGFASYHKDQIVPDYTVRIRASAVDIGNKHIVSAVTYNDQFPGPLLRFKEGQAVVRSLCVD